MKLAYISMVNVYSRAEILKFLAPVSVVKVFTSSIRNGTWISILKLIIRIKNLRAKTPAMGDFLSKDLRGVIMLI